MKLLSKIRFADEKIKEAFYKLENGDDSERELFRLINPAMDNIEEMLSVAFKSLRSSFPRSMRVNMVLLICGNMTYLEDGV